MSLLSLLCLLLTILLAVALWALRRLWLRSQGDAERLAKGASEQRALCDVIDVWLWRSDAAHVLEWLQPPASSGEAGVDAVAREPVWQRFGETEGSSLRSQLEGQRPLVVATVERALAGGGLPARGELRASRLSAPDGSFDGYLGMVRESQRVEPAPAVRAPPPGAEDPEHSAFGYTVSHDLRAPIRVVDGFARILKEDYGSLLDRIGNDHLDRVLSAAARMNGMIDALLAVSKLSSQPLSRQSVNLSQLAGYVAEELRRQQPERGVQLTIEPGMQAIGDPALLRVVIENLLGNAWKYSGRVDPAVIRFGRHPERPGVFSVSDNGAGFDMRHADRLFGMFQRLHGASEFEGTGIGLASVRRIVRRHGGDIWADAEPGRGATFHFSLGSR